MKVQNGEQDVNSSAEQQINLNITAPSGTIRRRITYKGSERAATSRKEHFKYQAEIHKLQQVLQL